MAKPKLNGKIRPIESPTTKTLVRLNGSHAKSRRTVVWRSTALGNVNIETGYRDRKISTVSGLCF
jgi:hypothetical protein